MPTSSTYEESGTGLSKQGRLSCWPDGRQEPRSGQKSCRGTGEGCALFDHRPLGAGGARERSEREGARATNARPCETLGWPRRRSGYRTRRRRDRTRHVEPLGRHSRKIAPTRFRVEDWVGPMRRASLPIRRAPRPGERRRGTSSAARPASEAPRSPFRSRPRSGGLGVTSDRVAVCFPWETSFEGTHPRRPFLMVPCHDGSVHRP